MKGKAFFTFDFVHFGISLLVYFCLSCRKRGKDSLPWTVYSLKKPKLFEVYKEMIENSNSFKSRDDNTYNYLSLESFLILQMGLDSKLDVCNDTDDILVRSTHRINSLELAKIYFRLTSKFFIVCQWHWPIIDKY